MNLFKQQKLCRTCVWGTQISSDVTKCMFGKCVIRKSDKDSNRYTDGITGQERVVKRGR